MFSKDERRRSRLFPKGRLGRRLLPKQRNNVGQRSTKALLFDVMRGFFGVPETRNNGDSVFSLFRVSSRLSKALFDEKNKKRNETKNIKIFEKIETFFGLLLQVVIFYSLWKKKKKKKN